MDNKPCKLTFQHWDETVTIEKDHSDVTLNDFMEMLETLTIAVGFNKESIEEYVVEWSKDILDGK